MPEIQASALYAIAHLGELLILLPLTLILAAWCAASKDLRGAIVIIGTVTATLGIVAILKFFSTLWGNPWQPHWTIISNLFPSGHIAMSIVVYGTLSLCLLRSRSRLFWPIATFATVIIGLIAVERILHNVHPPLDVLGGAIIGGTSLMTAALLWPQRPLNVKYVPVLAAALVLVFYFFYGVGLNTPGWVADAVQIFKNMKDTF